MSKISTFKFNRNLEYSHRYDYNNYTYYRYSHLLFRSLINRGHKLKAFNFMIALKLQLKLRERVDPNLIILVALLKITPDILVYPLKLGGAVQKVPLAICARKQYTFAVKWVVKSMKEKHGRYTVTNVADTLISAIYGRGPSIDRKISVYENCILNRHLIRFFKF